MSDHEAHARMIASAPQDQAPRLVFADLLEDTGCPATAHLLRNVGLPAPVPGRARRYYPGADGGGLWKDGEPTVIGELDWTTHPASPALEVTLFVLAGGSSGGALTGILTAYSAECRALCGPDGQELLLGWFTRDVDYVLDLLGELGAPGPGGGAVSGPIRLAGSIRRSLVRAGAGDRKP